MPLREEVQVRLLLPKSKLFALSLLLSLLACTLPALAGGVPVTSRARPLSEMPMMGVSNLKAGLSNGIECGNNPINCVDPEGLLPVADFNPTVQVNLLPTSYGPGGGLDLDLSVLAIGKSFTEGRVLLEARGYRGDLTRITRTGLRVPIPDLEGVRLPLRQVDEVRGGQTYVSPIPATGYPFAVTDIVPDRADSRFQKWPLAIRPQDIYTADDKLRFDRIQLIVNISGTSFNIRGLGDLIPMDIMNGRTIRFDINLKHDQNDMLHDFF